MLTQILFVIFAIIAIVCALMVITRKNPVASAMWLVGSFFSLAAIYTLLGAFFIGIVQILVYAGAIMVLFLFVIMLLNLGNDFEPDLRGAVWKVVAAGSALVMLALLARTLSSGATPAGSAGGPGGLARLTAEHGAVGVVGIPMFLHFGLPLQITGIFLLVAVVGAVVLAKRQV
ncbi:MAG TPA: NADH-quinone oxidoreductase subunit J [Longimicrobiaceae bacterium]|nr:NADH-quinone oxidoreductase subunit J [Longimicrobiaceae bacterium]